MGTVHVVGAGLAGLSASVALAESGARVVLHEAAKQAGGRCRSYYDPALGLTIDNGNGTPPTRPFGNQTSVPYNFSWTDGAPDAAGTARLARAVGVSPRTLERRFQAETGMTLGRWRQHRLLLCGLEHIAAGGSVAEAAVASGYASPSGYIAAFRKAFAATPGRYFR